MPQLADTLKLMRQQIEKCEQLVQAEADRLAAQPPRRVWLAMEELPAEETYLVGRLAAVRQAMRTIEDNPGQEQEE